MRDILMAVKGTPSGIMFISPETPVKPDTKINFVIDDSLYSYIGDPQLLVVFKWNEVPQLLTDNRTIVKSAGTSNDTFELYIRKLDSDSDSDSDFNNDKLDLKAINLDTVLELTGGSISGKSGEIIVTE